MVPTQAPHAARFQPVIFSDAGSNLYPLCDMPSDALPKALVPVLNRPMIAFPLQWLVTAGFKSCLLVAPVAEHAALAAALRTLHLLPPNADAASVDANAKPNVAVTVGVTSATLPGAENLNSSPSSPSITVELLPFGPKVGESVRSLAQPSASVTRVRWGTAQLLYWLAATRKLELDPLVMPVDLIAPQMPLASLLATHLAATPEPPTISCLFYERGAGEGTGKERERDGPANLFTAYSRVPVRVQEGIQAPTDGSRRDISVHEPLLVMDSDDVSDKNASDLEVRMSLLWKHPHVRISTALLDSFVYVMRLQPLLPLLEMHPELNSITGQLVPFVVKCAWQTRLSEKAHWMVSPAQAAEERALHERNSLHTPSLPPWTSVTEGMPAAPQLYRPRAEMVIARLRPEAQRPLPPSVLPNSETDKKGASAPSDEAFIARANTVPTYLECNRYVRLPHSPSFFARAPPARPSLASTPCRSSQEAAACRLNSPKQRQRMRRSTPRRSCRWTASSARARASTSAPPSSTRFWAATASSEKVHASCAPFSWTACTSATMPRLKTVSSARRPRLATAASSRRRTSGRSTLCRVVQSPRTKN